MNNSPKKRNLVLLAPFFSKETPGESWSTFKWVEGLSEHFQTTVLTTHKSGWESHLPESSAARCVNWNDPALPKTLDRLSWELKPTYVLYYLRARQWLKRNKSAIAPNTIVHQLNPLALRYPSPAAGLFKNLVLGPHAGSLPNPPGFEAQQTDRQMYRKLRNLDALRFRYDPMLRSSYRQAQCMLVVAPYVKTLLADVGVRKFVYEAETGIEEIGSPRLTVGDRIRFLFVGRLIPTKGLKFLLDAWQMISPDFKSKVSLDLYGDGELRQFCEASAKLDPTITVHGRRPKAEIQEAYKKSDVFIFPSIREPSGNVVFEALGSGLPVICVKYGGPGFVVTREVGWPLEPSNPDDLVLKLASSITGICSNPDEIVAKSKTSIEYASERFLWRNKISRIRNMYCELFPEGD